MPSHPATAAAMLALALAAPAAAAQPLADIDDVLQPVLARHKVPALAGAIVTTRGPVAIGAVGVRKAGTAVKVTAEDKWHLGSETKAMTATLIALLVERGRMKWETTVSDGFPDIAEFGAPAFRKTTIAHLLSHRAGIVENLAWGGIPQRGSTRDQREAAMKLLAKAPRRFDPGADFLYSNAGYVVAGSMAERYANTAWEEMMTRMLFEPLGMRSAGFGGTGTFGLIDQPWPHLENGRPASSNGPAVDNPPVMGPAGTVHASIADWSKFIIDHMKGARGERALLAPYSYKMLHTPPAGNYALGWVVLERSWAGGTVLTHAGSNTMNYCVVWMAPKINLAALACTNQGGPVAAKATDDAVGAMIRYHQR